MDARDLLPDELINSCCTRILAVSNDREHLLVEKLGPMGSDPIKLYWVSVAARSAKIVVRIPSGGMSQEVAIDPSGKYALLRMPEDDEQNLYLIDLQNGVVTDVTSASSDFPYAIDWMPNSLGFTYSQDVGTSQDVVTWLFDIQKMTQELLIEGGYDADWSSDGQKMVFRKNDGLWIADNLGQNQTPVRTIDGLQVIADFPEWVPIMGYNSIVYWNNHGWILHDLDSSKQTILLSGSYTNIGFRSVGYSVQWSPDGHWFLGYITSPQVYLCNIDSGECTGLDASISSDRNNCRYGWWMTPWKK